MSSLSAPRWRCAPVDALARREWDSEWVVRNERTGSTHLLGPLAGTVLELLLEARDALSVAELTQRLDPALFAPGADAAADVEGVLSEFRRLGLAEARDR